LFPKADAQMHRKCLLYLTKSAAPTVTNMDDDFVLLLAMMMAIVTQAVARLTMMAIPIAIGADGCREHSLMILN